MEKSAKLKPDQKQNTLDVIYDRLELLENQLELDQNSKLKKFGALAGLIALFISICVGGLEIYSRTIVASATSYNSAYDRTTQIGDKLSQLNQEAATLIANGKFAELNVRMPVIHSERIRLLGQLDKIDSNVISDLNSADLIHFSGEYAQIHSINKAIKLAQKGLDKADTYSLRVEGRRYLAQALFVQPNPDNIRRARNQMQQAINIIDSQKHYSSVSLKRGIYDSWIRGEVYANNCEYARTLILDFHAFLESSQAPQFSISLDDLNQYFSGGSPCKL